MLLFRAKAEYNIDTDANTIEACETSSDWVYSLDLSKFIVLSIIVLKNMK